MLWHNVDRLFFPVEGTLAEINLAKNGSQSNMSDRSVVEIYRAKNGSQAYVFAMELNEAGIKAQVQGTTFHPATATADNLLTDTTVWWDAPRIVVFADDAERAKQLLLKLETRERKKAEEVVDGAPIEAVCEECGCRASFPASTRGSVQDCPQCGAYLDVGDEERPDDLE